MCSKYGFLTAFRIFFQFHQLSTPVITRLGAFLCVAVFCAAARRDCLVIEKERASLIVCPSHHLTRKGRVRVLLGLFRDRIYVTVAHAGSIDCARI